MNGNSPVLAVVLPAYGHPSLMIDAIESALRQRTQLSFRIVLVNDGCPLRQTDQVCRTYARAHPERVLYIHKENGGLSSARNRGVTVALQAWPSLDAIYFLDADNRFSPQLLEKAYNQLLAHPEADWVFPDHFLFGSANDYYDSAGPFSRLQMLLRNYCDAGSLVRRRVFDRGLAYDEAMRLGFEDWEFWLHCMKQGSEGLHGHAVGFLYRKRPESMVTNSLRDHGQILSYMRRKHAGLFTLRYAHAIAGQEFPRFALYLPENGEFALTSDLRSMQRLTWPSFARLLRRWRDSKQMEYCPATVVIAAEATLTLLRERGLAANMLWLLEADLAEHPLATLEIQQDFGLATRTIVTESGVLPLGSCRGVHVCALRRELLEQCLRGDAGAAWVSAPPEHSTASVRARRLHLEHVEHPSELRATALDGLRELVLRKGSAYRHVPTLSMIPPRTTMRPHFEAQCIFRDLFQTTWPPPLPSPLTTRNVGFVVPAGSSGDVDRAVPQLARLVLGQGWHAHLFVIGAEQAPVLREFQAVFTSVHLVPDARLATPSRLVSLLGTMDAAINCQCPTFYGAAGELRRLGVKILTYLQSVESRPEGLLGGQSATAVEYEHALDRLVATSRRLETWLMAWGVPREKIIYLPNGPGMDVPPVRAQLAFEERAQRTAEQPLRVLCAVRHAQRNGLDRLAAIVRESNSRGLQVEWRCLTEPAALPEAAASDWQMLAPYRQRPGVHTHAWLRQYTWADVLLDVGRVEPSALAVLDAQQLGCVPLATNVGAAAEWIEEGRTGFLFPNEDPANGWIDHVLTRLEHFQGNRPLLLALARQAAEQAATRGWPENARDWLACLNAWTPAKGG